MVVAWMIANAVVAMAVSEAYNTSNVGSNFYLKFILWSVAAVAIFRALGSSAFGVINIVHWLAEGKVQVGLERLERISVGSWGGSWGSGGGGGGSEGSRARSSRSSQMFGGFGNRTFGGGGWRFWRRGGGGSG